jgi:hypothetical protein
MPREFTYVARDDGRDTWYKGKHVKLKSYDVWHNGRDLIGSVHQQVSHWSKMSPNGRIRLYDYEAIVWACGTEFYSRFTHQTRERAARQLLEDKVK